MGFIVSAPCLPDVLEEDLPVSATLVILASGHHKSEAAWVTATRLMRNSREEWVSGHWAFKKTLPDASSPPTTLPRRSRHAVRLTGGVPRARKLGPKQNRSRRSGIRQVADATR